MPKDSKGQLPNNKLTMATIWVMVLILPHQLAAMTMPSEAAKTRRPVTANSLAMMMMATHEEISPVSTRQIKAEQTNSLSAKGSMNLPKVVISLYFRAMWPSSMSVSAAITKMIPPIIDPYFISDRKKKMKKGIIMIRKI